MKTVTCTCCAADLTSPQFFEGKPYGWTCILKVAPRQKRVRDNGLWAACTITYKFSGRDSLDAVAETDCGAKFILPAWSINSRFLDFNNDCAKSREDAIKLTRSTSIGMIKLAKCKNGNQPIWRGRGSLIDELLS